MVVGEGLHLTYCTNIHPAVGWEAVLRDFHLRHGLAGVAVSIHDMGATPAVVSLRLDQAVAAIPGATP